MAGAMTAALRVGCSGWSYKDWRGVVYPADLPQRRWFDYYQQLFDTVELNSTYYRLPRATTVERWAAAARPGFEFAVKLGAFGSHRMKLRDAATWLPNHLDRVERLGDHLGPNLVQLPPRWKRNAERLDEFLGTAPTAMRWAVELRDPSWIHDDVFEVLRAATAQRSASTTSSPIIPSSSPPTGPTSGSMGLRPSASRTTAGTVPSGSPLGCHDSVTYCRPVATCTPTSTTTGSVTPFATRPCCDET